VTLKNRLREIRTGSGWTQEDLARSVGVTRQTIIAIEKGGYEPSVRLALELAGSLDVSVDDVFWLSSTKEERT
jgi:putative transcriptional regulator